MPMRCEKVCVLFLGGTAYGICEMLWRGYTHWTMVVLGGICFLGLYEGQRKFGSLSLPARCFAGAVFITSLELVTGSIVNIALDMGVWDYSEMPFNFMGQICPQFFCLWTVLCFPALWLCGNISRYFDRMYV